jgi:GNAT superfamily N-acetyltransferase
VITRDCHDCGSAIAAGSVEEFPDAFLAHVRARHADWPFPDAAVRFVGENVARLTGPTERLEQIGAITVEPVTEDRLDDWASFFDTDSHAGNPVGGACYCTEAHVIEAGKPPPPHPGAKAHRQLMLDRLRSGRSFGYLAYVDGRAAGWVNASRRADYLLHRTGEGDETVVGIACFVIAPPYRRHGLAVQLLNRVVADAPARGAEVVEAYPLNSGLGDHRGSRNMFEARGFTAVEERQLDTVMQLRV